MPLPKRLSQLLQKQADRLFKDVLSENPEVLKSYVNGGLSAVATALTPINVFMRHLLTVQGLDPDSVPGENQRALIQQAFNSTFVDKHEADYDDDYDTSWVHKKYFLVKNKLDVTEDKFMALTDLSKLDNGPEVLVKTKFDELVAEMNPVAPDADKKELPLVTTYTTDEVQALKTFVESMEKKGGIKVVEKQVSKDSKPSKSGKRSPKIKRATGPESFKEIPSTLEVKSDRVVRPSSKRTPGRNLGELASKKKAKEKAAREATPEFKAEQAALEAELKVKLARATELTNLMIQKGLCRADDQSRKDQIDSMLNWGDNNFDALERVIHKYAPTKDAVAENKFKGSFRRVQK